MKKFITLILLLSLVAPLGAQTIGAIGDADLPKWVPSVPEIRSNMITVFNAAIDFVMVKRAGYEITSAWKEGNYVWVRINRFTLVTDVKLGEFENIEAVSVNKGVLKVTYKLTTPRAFGWAELGIGVGVGAILTIITYSLVNK